MSIQISSGLYRGRKLCVPKKNVRPSSLKCRQALFNICQNKIENSFFLDLFAGSGAIGIEALSRMAQKVYFIDNDKESISCIKKNLTSLNLLNKATIFFSDAFDALKKIKDKFDIIYIDPPYISYEDKSFLDNLLKDILSKKLMNLDCWVFIEIPKNVKVEISSPSFRLEKIRSYGSTSLIELHFQ